MHVADPPSTNVPPPTVLDRYGHLLPGTEAPVNDALDALALDARIDAR